VEQVLLFGAMQFSSSFEKVSHDSMYFHMVDYDSHDIIFLHHSTSLTWEEHRNNEKKMIWT